jgi:hypothetical protein
MRDESPPGRPGLPAGDLGTIVLREALTSPNAESLICMLNPVMT